MHHGPGSKSLPHCGIAQEASVLAQFSVAQVFNHRLLIRLILPFFHVNFADLIKKTLTTSEHYHAVFNSSAFFVTRILTASFSTWSRAAWRLIRRIVWAPSKLLSMIFSGIDSCPYPSSISFLCVSSPSFLHN